MKKLLVLTLGITTLAQNSTEQYKLENSIECLDKQAVAAYLSSHTLSEKRKALITQHADDLVRLHRPTSLGKSFHDLSRFALGSLGTAMSLMVLAVALDKNIIKLGKITEIKLGGMLTLAMIPICSVAGYVSGQLVLKGWRMECAHEKFNKARDIQYLLHGASAQ